MQQNTQLWALLDHYVQPLPTPQQTVPHQPAYCSTDSLHRLGLATHVCMTLQRSLDWCPPVMRLSYTFLPTAVVDLQAMLLRTWLFTIGTIPQSSTFHLPLIAITACFLQLPSGSHLQSRDSLPALLRQQAQVIA